MIAITLDPSQAPNGNSSVNPNMIVDTFSDEILLANNRVAIASPQEKLHKLNETAMTSNIKWPAITAIPIKMAFTKNSIANGVKNVVNDFE